MIISVEFKKKFIIASSTFPFIKEKIFPNAEIVDRIPGTQLVGSTYFDGVFGSTKSIYSASFVESTFGTGLVHIAPAHGQEDFDFWNANVGTG